MKNKRVLVISDLHAPYGHPDTVNFLRAIKSKYNPDRIIQIGDELDYHAISYHETDPDLLGANDELETAIRRLSPVYKLFPKVDLIDSNHGSLIYRKGKTAGIPKAALRPYREILKAPLGWRWHFDLTIKLSDGSNCYFHHGKGSNALKVSQSMGMSFVCGHYHESFNINYWGNSLGLYWSMMVGCLIENDSLAFSYNKTNLKRPIIGCGIILNGHPKLLPMVLNKEGRWNKKIN